MLQLGELQQADDPNALNAKLSYGGDTLNTALLSLSAGRSSGLRDCRW